MSPYAILLLITAASFVGGSTLSSDHIGKNLRGRSKCNKCDTTNPCIEGGDQYYFEHCQSHKFIQCDDVGGCHTLHCGDGTVWDQDKSTCVVGV
mmetsp:Transcript_46799/g.86836  ORF Transcript_46799/g.86836 Transcript_46799/m.86836 type:complete len:94 (-) Transcript_46799:292-573(-)